MEFAPEPEYLKDGGLRRSLATLVILIASLAGAALLGTIYAVWRCRRDRAVQAMGYGFMVSLVLGVLLGEVFLCLHAFQLAEPDVTDMAFCHLETGILLLHINMLHAPLMAKLWRVFFKIRRAETRMLKIWDGEAVQMTGLQLAAAIVLFVAHLVTVSSSDGNMHHERQGCFEASRSEDVNTLNTERWFYGGQLLLLTATVLPAPFLIAYITSSSFSAIFHEWPRLVQTLLTLELAATLNGVTYYVSQDFIVLAARFIAVQCICAVTVGAYIWPALRPRLRRRRQRWQERMVKEPSLQRQAKLQEHLSMIMQERHNTYTYTYTYHTIPYMYYTHAGEAHGACAQAGGAATPPLAAPHAPPGGDAARPRQLERQV